MLTSKQLGQKFRRQAYTLVEVLISSGVVGIMVASVYTGFISGFGSVAITREELRATQIITQKLEAMRLLTWGQMSNCPTTFQEFYYPPGAGNNTAGTVFYGTLSAAGVATNIPDAASYKSNLHLVTVTVVWTNYPDRRTPVTHTRRIQTLSAVNGLQKYIYGVNP